MSDDNGPQDIVTVLTYYGAEMLSTRTRDYGWFSVNCPFHADARASARASIEAGAFACLGCGVKGDAISIICQQERLNYAGAVAFYERITGGKTSGVQRPVLEKFGGYDILGKPRTYEPDGSGISRWLRRRTSDGR